MASSRAVALVVVLVVGALTMPMPLAGVTPADAADADSTQCSNRVVYDAFRFNNETVSKAANGSAESTAKNTEVKVEQSTGFVRLNATNPNGYCVEFHVRLDERIVQPAELGDVKSNDGNVTARWSAVRDFEREETFTEVVFTLPAGSQASFAPSKLRVESLSWTGTAKSTGASWFSELTNISIGDDDPELDQRTYTFNATNSSETITISLQNESTGGTVEEWTAMYRTSNQTGWTPVTTDTTEPVFYRQPDDSRVQFVFNDPTAEVRFTANPTTWDDINHQWDAWWSGTDTIESFLGGLFD